MYNVDNIYVYIFSWKKVTENAINLHKNVSNYFKNTIIINCDENINIENSIQLNDNFYYGGQFDIAIKNIPEGNILCIITGDVSPNADWEKISVHSVNAFNSNKIGIYAPNVEVTGHPSRNELLWDELYSVNNTDCTCWFILPEIVSYLKNISYYELSNLGWGIDLIFIEESNKRQKYVVRDYSVYIVQPLGTGYNTNVARIQMGKLINYYRNMK